MTELLVTSPKRLGQVLFWSAPVEDSEFTAEDPLALDYLAQQVGLFLLPTLTTRSSRAQAFAMVLYGLDLADRAIAKYGLPNDDDVRRALFERWERFWALASLESHDGRIQRGDSDAMRGIRGASRAWFEGDRPLPLDYPLISRQLELGHLGAYLAPLRASRLVLPGTLRITPAADDIVKAFWGEPDENTPNNRYDEYAMLALDKSEKKLPRKHRNLTLAKVGERSRLSCLSTRPAQCERLYNALFVSPRDSTTHPISQLVEAAAKDAVYDTRVLLDAALASTWAPLSPELTDLFHLARRFGEVMHHSLTLFDRVYAALWSAGWQGSRKDIARAVLPDDELVPLRAAIEHLLSTPQLPRLRGLPAHGRSFLRFLEEASTAAPDGIVESLLALHHRVQKDRRRGDAWIRDDAGHLTLLLTTYNARPAADRFPSLRLGVVRQILVDCGRIPATDATEETAS